jgi:hypothetical protein
VKHPDDAAARIALDMDVGVMRTARGQRQRGRRRLVVDRPQLLQRGRQQRDLIAPCYPDARRLPSMDDGRGQQNCVEHAGRLFLGDEVDRHRRCGQLPAHLRHRGGLHHNDGAGGQVRVKRQHTRNQWNAADGDEELWQRMPETCPGASSWHDEEALHER